MPAFGMFESSGSDGFPSSPSSPWSSLSGLAIHGLEVLQGVPLQIYVKADSVLDNVLTYQKCDAPPMS